LSGGATFGGWLEGEGRLYEVGPGWLASLTGAVRLLGAPDNLPFVTLTLSFGWTSAATRERGGALEEERISATDARLGVLAGVSLWDVLSPYLVARAFGGPVSFRQRGQDRVGSDKGHYTLGLGATVAIPGGFSLTSEALPLGERTLSIGVSKGF
jgi:hypothetical protein